MELAKLTKIGRKKSKRIGRGYGSTKGGHTVGKGQKGQKSRSGYKRTRGWIRESKVKSLPKLRGIGKRNARRGYFKSKEKEIVINISDLGEFKNGETIDLAFLRKREIVKTKGKKIRIKILGQGELKKKLIIKGLDISKSARQKIEKAGGKVI